MYLPEVNQLKPTVCKYLLMAFLFLGLTDCKPGAVGSDSSKTKAQVISTDQYKIWQFIDTTSLTGRFDAKQLPQKYQTLILNIKKAKIRLSNLEPKEKVPNQLKYEKTDADHVLLQLPWNDGQFYTFQVKNSNIFSPELAKKFPNIRSYSGEKADDSSTHLRLDVNPSGLFAMITTPSQTLFIRPMDNESEIYLCYDKDDVDRNNRKYYEPPIKTRMNK